MRLTLPMPDGLGKGLAVRGVVKSQPRSALTAP